MYLHPKEKQSISKNQVGIDPCPDPSLAGLCLQEKKDMLTIAGAELIQVPAVPYKNPNNYVKYSGRLAEALAKVG